MGDRTWASVTFRIEYEGLYKHHTQEDYHDETMEVDSCITLVDYEASYGNMKGVTKVLDGLKIPYDRRWESGSEYGAGDEYIRFDGEERYVCEVYDSTDGLIGISQVLKEIKEGLNTVEKIKDYLNKEAEKFIPHGGEFEVGKILLREFTAEESAIIMKFKMTKEK